MEKIVRNIALLTIALLYCFCMSIYGVHAFAPEADFSKLSHAETEHYQVVVSSNLVCCTPQSENTISAFNHVPRSSFKNHFNGFSTCLKATGQLFINLFSPSNVHCREVIARLQKTILLFPFHSFW